MKMTLSQVDDYADHFSFDNPLANRAYLAGMGVDARDSDKVFGSDYIYCSQHRTIHSSGMCNVSIVNKYPLVSTTRGASFEESRSLGFPMS